MCKLAILHIPSTLNYGSMMMATNLIYYLNKETKERFTFYVDNDEEEGIERLIKSTGVMNIQKLSNIGVEYTPKFKSTDNKVIKLMKNMKFIRNYYVPFKENGFEHIVVLGGDDFSTSYTTSSKLSLLTKLLKINNLKNHGLNVYLVGQTIGPFSRELEIIAKKVFSNMKIYTRDSESYLYLNKKLGLREVYELSDLAYLDLPMQESDSSNILKSFSLEKEKYITLVPSGLWNKYCKNKDDYIKGWLDIVLKVLDKTDYKIAMLAHVIRQKSNDNDAEIINMVMAEVPDKYAKRVIPITNVMQPYNARQILGNGLITITGRMHAAISTFQMGKPAISLAYSVKYNRVIGQGLQRQDMIINASKNGMWGTVEIGNKILDVFDYTINNYDRLTKEIQKKVNQQKEKAKIQIKEIKNFIEKGKKII